MTLSEGIIFGACNPLLDISAHVKSELLQRYDLKANSAILGEDKHLQIYEDLKTDKTSEIEYIPGGSAQNALRTASWILKYPNAATFMGCVGRDANAEIMRQKAKEVGLNVAYQVNDSTATGTCAVLVTGNDRSLVAHLGAANNFTIDHLNDPHNWALVEKAKVHYISGFFFTVCPEAIMRIAKFSSENNRTFSINLSAPFLSQFFKDKIMEAFPYVDILFGNDDEARTFAKSVLNSDETNTGIIAAQISQLPKANNKQRIVIITQGDKPVVLAIGNDVKEIPAHYVAPEKIIDTNGAGDAFVGGFLAQYVKGESIEKCIDCGIWISSLVIQRSGCTFPENMDYK